MMTSCSTLVGDEPAVMELRRKRCAPLPSEAIDDGKKYTPARAKQLSSCSRHESCSLINRLRHHTANCWQRTSARKEKISYSRQVLLSKRRYALCNIQVMSRRADTGKVRPHFALLQQSRGVQKLMITHVWQAMVEVGNSETSRPCNTDTDI